MTLTRATVRESPLAAAAELVLPRSEIERLGLTNGAVVALEVQATDTWDAHAREADVSDDERTLRAAIDELERGAGAALSDADLSAMRAEIAALAARGARGGTSPTLERLLQERGRRSARRGRRARAPAARA